MSNLVYLTLLWVQRLNQYLPFKPELLYHSLKQHFLVRRFSLGCPAFCFLVLGFFLQLSGVTAWVPAVLERSCSGEPWFLFVRMVGSFCEAVLTSLFSAQSSITFPKHFQWSFKTNVNAGSKHDLHKWDSAGAGSVYKNDPKLRTWWLSVNNLLYALKIIGCVWQRVLSPGGSVWIEK